KVFGLTMMFPILSDQSATPSHDLQIRRYLATLPTGPTSLFALAPSTHMARLVVMDDVIYVGTPACEEHLKSKYLVFEANSDVDIDEYAAGLARSVPGEVEAIWRHCAGYPGVADVSAFVKYAKACQVPTTFYFAAVNDKSLPETLKALQTKRAVAEFVAEHQDLPAQDLQREFVAFMERLKVAATPVAGSGNDGWSR
ncbi:MAG: hypothetical protein ABI142_07970, partial [Bryocella sp.]